MTIGEVASRSGLRPSTLRYYEEIGLLPAPERQSGRRVYGDDVLERLAAIRVSQAAGFSLSEIRTLLSGFSEDTPPGERWRAMAGRKLPEVEDLIRRAERMRELLLAGIDCRCVTLADCEVLEANS